jgi:transposase
MGAPKKYEREFVERAVRMYRDGLAEGGDSIVGARRHVGSLLDMDPAKLRNWVGGKQRRNGVRPPASASASASRGVDSEEVRSLKKRVAER